MIAIYSEPVLHARCSEEVFARIPSVCDQNIGIIYPECKILFCLNFLHSLLISTPNHHNQIPDAKLGCPLLLYIL